MRRHGERIVAAAPTSAARNAVQNPASPVLFVFIPSLSLFICVPTCFAAHRKAARAHRRGPARDHPRGDTRSRRGRKKRHKTLCTVRNRLRSRCPIITTAARERHTPWAPSHTKRNETIARQRRFTPCTRTVRHAAIRGPASVRHPNPTRFLTRRPRDSRSGKLPRIEQTVPVPLRPAGVRNPAARPHTPEGATAAPSHAARARLTTNEMRRQ
jgi:hypothetical protein